MKKFNTALIGYAFLVSVSSPLLAQELILGAGFADFSSGISEDGGMISAEYHHTPFYENDRLSVQLGGALSAHFTGDFHIGVGVAGAYQLQNQWFLEGSVMPGAYYENEDDNGLGSTFEIRSLFAVGRRLKNGSAISVGLTHKSNASTASYNPGVNSLLLRWHAPLKR